MRIRILKAIISSRGEFTTGAVVDLPEKIVRPWIKAGLAMQDKSLNGAPETKEKSRAGYWCNRCGVTHRSDSKMGRRHLKLAENVAQ